MDSVSNIIGRRVPDEKQFLEDIKRYIGEHYDSYCSVSVSQRNYVLAVASASLASTLQMERIKIAKACGLDKPLRI
jgi:hypothetical protein